MLRTYSNNISVAANTTIPFNVNKILTGSTVSHHAGSGDVVIKTPGYYKVDFNISTTIDTTGPLILQMYADNIAIPDAVLSMQVTTAEQATGSISTIIYARPGTLFDTSILSVKPNVDLVISNVALGINRLG